MRESWGACKVPSNGGREIGPESTSSKKWTQAWTASPDRGDDDSLYWTESTGRCWSPYRLSWGEPPLTTTIDTNFQSFTFRCWLTLAPPRMRWWLMSSLYSQMKMADSHWNIVGKLSTSTVVSMKISDKMKQCTCIHCIVIFKFNTLQWLQDSQVSARLLPDHLETLRNIVQLLAKIYKKNI